MLHCIVTGGVDTGWTFYTPFSTAFSNTKVIEAGLGNLHRRIFVHSDRFELRGHHPPYAGAGNDVVAHAAVHLGALRDQHHPVARHAGAGGHAGLVVLERAFHLGIFDPTRGGDPLLFQHLFWFYSHPAVYIMILPSMGVVSEIVPCFTRKRIFGYNAIALSSIAIAVFGFLVWAHHMFVAGISLYSALIFSILSYLVAVPSAIKVFNWTATMYKGSITFSTPMLYAFGFIGLFTMGGLTGLFLAALGIDVHVTDTYFVIAHFHYIMVGGAVMGYLGGMHFWWPKISGRMYPEWLGKLPRLRSFSLDST